MAHLNSAEGMQNIVLLNNDQNVSATQAPAQHGAALVPLKHMLA